MQIDSNIPIPATKRVGAALKYPFDRLALNIGDSFAEPAEADTDKQRQRLSAGATAWAKRNGIDVSFTARVMNTDALGNNISPEVRVWSVPKRPARVKKAAVFT